MMLLPLLLSWMRRAHGAWMRLWFARPDGALARLERLVAPRAKALLPPPAKPVLPPSPEEVYIARRTAALHASFDPAREQALANANTSAKFYDRAGLKVLMKNSGSALENEWAARVLVESTPRGNVYMHYDTFRGAFAYYCDAGLPYAIANAAAMRYVLVFACRDLFIDDATLGVARRSPMAVLEEADEHAITKKNAEALRAQLDADKALPFAKPGADGALPFAKLKRYGAPPPVKGEAAEAEAAADADAARPLPAMQNRFHYLGRTRDMQVLQRGANVPTMTARDAARWREKGVQLAGEIASRTEGESEYKFFKRQKAEVDRKLAETRVGETAASRLAAHRNESTGEVSDEFMNSYLDMRSHTGKLTRPDRAMFGEATDRFA